MYDLCTPAAPLHSKFKKHGGGLHIGGRRVYGIGPLGAKKDIPDQRLSDVKGAFK